MAVQTAVDKMTISTVTRPDFQVVDSVDTVKVTPVVKLEKSTFNLGQALNGVSVGFYLKGELVPVLGFRENDLNDPAKSYVGTVDGVSYYFNNLGGCSDLDPDHTLQMLNVEIPVKRDTVASRGDSESTESIEISSLQPREQFALAAMQSIINKIDTPILLLDGYKITQISTLAFNIANSMMNFSAEYRAKTEHPTEPADTITVDGNTLSTNSEKIMYNIASHLESVKKSLDILNTTFKDQEAKVKKVNVTNTDPIKVNINEMPNVNIGNTPNVNVANTPTVAISGTPDARVSNMITEPVSVIGSVEVSGNVNVDNTVDVNVKKKYACK